MSPQLAIFEKQTQSNKFMASKSWLGKYDTPKTQYPMKVTDEFIHCGLGYSSQRRGMVVVENNAIGSQPIQLDS